jgi:hypothetical protein
MTTLAISSSDRLIVAGPTAAWRVSDRVGLGVAVLATLHTLYDRVDLTDARPEGFVQFTSSIDSLSAGLAAAAGARIELGRGVTLGLSARTPSLAIWGAGDRLARTVRAPRGAELMAETSLLSVEPRRLWPALFRAGAAWSVAGRFAVSVDGSLALGLRYDTLRTRTGMAVSQSALKPVANAAAGAEWYARRALVFRAGVFTDLSGAPTPGEDGSQADRVDYLGASLTGTFMVGGASTTLGAIGTYGFARVVGVDVAAGSYEPVVGRGEQWRIYLVWAGTTRL